MEMSDHQGTPLKKSLGLLGNLAITLSNITPASSVFIIVPALLLTTGTGILWSFLIGLVIALAIGLCDAELGSLYPTAGGPYYVVKKVLGNYWGFIALSCIAVQAVVLTPAIAMGDGLYLHSFFPSLNASVIGCIVMLASAVIAIFPISSNGYITGVFLVIELVALILLSFIGFSHIHQSASILVTTPHALVGGHLSPIGAGALIGGVVTALFAYNGYDQVITFGEETHGNPKYIGFAILAALGVTVVFEVVPSLAVLLGAPDLSKLFGDAAPISYVIKTTTNNTWNAVILTGILFAIFNATIAIILGFGRMLYSSAREESWPPAMNRALTKLHPRFKTPWVATLLIGVIGGLLCFASSFILLITFTSVLVAVIYALVAVSALITRVKGEKSPFRMILWPLPPLVALVGIVVALTQQTAKDLLITLGIFIIASLYYFFYQKRRNKEFKKELIHAKKL